MDAAQKADLVGAVLQLLRDLFWHRRVFREVALRAVTPDVCAAAVGWRGDCEPLCEAVLRIAAETGELPPVTTPLLRRALRFAHHRVAVALLRHADDATLAEAAATLSFDPAQAVARHGVALDLAFASPATDRTLAHLCLAYSEPEVLTRLLQVCPPPPDDAAGGGGGTLLAFAAAHAPALLGPLCCGLGPAALRAGVVEEEGRWEQRGTRLGALHWCLLTPGRQGALEFLVAEHGCNVPARVQTAAGLAAPTVRVWREAERADVFAPALALAGAAGVVEELHPLCVAVAFLSPRLPAIAPEERVANLLVLAADPQAVSIDASSAGCALECILRRQLWQGGAVKRLMQALFGALPSGRLIALHHALPTDGPDGGGGDATVLRSTSSYVNLILDVFPSFVDVNAPNERGVAPLHEACLHSMPLVVKALLAHPAIDLRSADTTARGDNVLQLAARHSTADTVAVLLRHPGVAEQLLETRDVLTSRSPLHHLCGRLELGAVAAWLERLERLRSGSQQQQQPPRRPKPLCTPSLPQGSNPLHLLFSTLLERQRVGLAADDAAAVAAAAAGLDALRLNVDAAATRLLTFELRAAATAAAASPTGGGQAQAGGDLVFRMLSEADAAGNTAVHLACRAGCLRFVEQVAEVTMDASGESALSWCLKNCRNARDETLFHSCAASVCEEAAKVVELLCKTDERWASSSAAEQAAAASEKEKKKKKRAPAPPKYTIRRVDRSQRTPIEMALQNRDIPGTVLAVILLQFGDVVGEGVFCESTARAAPSAISMLRRDDVLTFLTPGGGAGGQRRRRRSPLHAFAARGDAASVAAVAAKLGGDSPEWLATTDEESGDAVLHLLLRCTTPAVSACEALACDLFVRAPPALRLSLLAARGAGGQGLLHVCASVGRLRFAECALESFDAAAGAEARWCYADDAGNTPLQAALDGGWGDGGWGEGRMLLARRLAVKQRLVCPRGTVEALRGARLGRSLVLQAALHASADVFEAVVSEVRDGGGAAAAACAVDFLGNTVLHLAAASGAGGSAAVRMRSAALLRPAAVAAVAARNAQGMTPLGVAVRAGRAAAAAEALAMEGTTTAAAAGVGDSRCSLVREALGLTEETRRHFVNGIVFGGGVVGVEGDVGSSSSSSSTASALADEKDALLRVLLSSSVDGDPSAAAPAAAGALCDAAAALRLGTLRFATFYWIVHRLAGAADDAECERALRALQGVEVVFAAAADDSCGRHAYAEVLVTLQRRCVGRTTAQALLCAAADAWEDAAAAAAASAQTPPPADLFALSPGDFAGHVWEQREALMERGGGEGGKAVAFKFFSCVVAGMLERGLDEESSGGGGGAAATDASAVSSVPGLADIPDALLARACPAVHKVVLLMFCERRAAESLARAAVLCDLRAASDALPAAFFFAASASFLPVLAALPGFAGYRALLRLHEVALLEGTSPEHLRCTLRDGGDDDASSSGSEDYLGLFLRGRHGGDDAMLLSLLDFRPPVTEAVVCLLRARGLLAARNRRGDTLLHLIVLSDAPSVLRALLRAEVADGFEENGAGCTAFDYCRSAEMMAALSAFLGPAPIASLAGVEYVVCLDDAIRPTFASDPAGYVVQRLTRLCGCECLANIGGSDVSTQERRAKEDELADLEEALTEQRVVVFKSPAALGGAEAGPELWALHLPRRRALELLVERGKETGGHGDTGLEADADEEGGRGGGAGGDAAAGGASSAVDGRSDPWDANITTEEVETIAVGQLQRVKLLRALLNPFKSDVDLVELQKRGCLTSVFPVYRHDVEAGCGVRKRFAGVYPFGGAAAWLGMADPRRAIARLSILRAYSGEAIAFYFSWLSFYEVFLLPLTPVALGFLVLQQVEGYLTSLMGVYAAVCCVWGVVFVKQWARRETDLGVEWGVYRRPRADCPRATFRPLVDEAAEAAAAGRSCGVAFGLGDSEDRGQRRRRRRPKYLTRPNPFNPEQREPHYPPECRRPRYAVSLLLIVAFLAVSLTEFVVFVKLRDYLGFGEDFFGTEPPTATATLSLSAQEAQANPTVGAKEADTDVLYLGLLSIGNSVAVMVIEALYKMISEVLTEFENHKFPRDFSNSLVLKYMCLQLLNALVPPMYIVFSDSEKKGADEAFRNASLHVVLKLATEVAVGMIREYLLPSLTKAVSKRANRKIAPSVPKVWASVIEYSRTRIGEGYGTDDFKALYGEFAEIVLQFGYVMCFAAVCPAAVPIAFVNNFFEIKGDLYKVVALGKRILPNRAHGIGPWAILCKVLVCLSCTTNAFCLLHNPSFVGYFDCTKQELFLGIHVVFYAIYWTVCVRVYMHRVLHTPQVEAGRGDATYAAADSIRSQEAQRDNVAVVPKSRPTSASARPGPRSVPMPSTAAEANPLRRQADSRALLMPMEDAYASSSPSGGREPYEPAPKMWDNTT